MPRGGMRPAVTVIARGRTFGEAIPFVREIAHLHCTCGCVQVQVSQKALAMTCHRQG